MTEVLVDTAAWIGLLLADDPYHERAIRAFAEVRQRRGSFVTTSAILTEVLDGAASRDRRLSSLLRGAVQATGAEVVWMDEFSFERAWTFYDLRGDKQWSLTDCLSFCLMTERGLPDALTHDHHFEQAGFRALLRG